MTLDVGANRHTMVHGEDTLNVTKSLNITVQKRFHLVVNNSSITKIDATEQRSIGSNLELTVARDAITTVKRDATTKITGNEVTEVAKDSTLRVGKNVTVELTGGNRSTSIKAGTELLDVSDKIDIKTGKTLTIEAADEIVLKTGIASLIMKKDGSITIEGKDVTIKGAAKVETKAPMISSEASATNTLKGTMVKINS
jgi:type VI secretion system secreted protein VgrG